MEKKKIHLNFGNIANDEYKQWTHEAITEFLDLFPDYKDLFEITTEAIEKDKKILNRSFSKDELDKLVNIAMTEFSPSGYKSEDFYAVFPQQPDGTYKYQPSGDYKKVRGALFVLEQVHDGKPKDYSFPIEINFEQTSHSGLYGEGGMMSGVTMYLNTFENGTQGKDTQYKKDFFKMLLKHELGHTFQACSKGAQRQLDNSESGMAHCLNDDCIMLSGNKAHEAFEKNPKMTFCDDCKKEIEQHMRMIKDPNQIEVTNASQLNQNIETKDYDEEDNPNHPAIVRLIKETFRGYDIDIRATKEKQEDYPFEYNLYKKGEKAANGAQPNGKITITDEKNVTLRSEDISHFIATMKAVKENSGNAMRLNLIGSEEAKKAFAARAVIAGMITGVEVKNNPYSLEELKEINPMIEKVIQIEKQRDEAIKASKALEENTDTTQTADLEKSLHTLISSSYENYQQLSKEALPNFESLRSFESGVQAIKKARTRQIAAQVLAQRQRQQTK